MMNPDKSFSPATGFGVHPVVLLVSDPHAALAGAGLLSGAKRRLDGPFFYWSGKAGLRDCVIIVPSPGGAAAWYAATELACRRCEPSLLMGITRAQWLAPASPPDGFCAQSVVSCDFPAGFSIESGLSVPPSSQRWTAPDLARRIAAAWTLSSNPIAQSRAMQKTIALCVLGCLNPQVMEIPSVPSGLLGEWEVQAVDRESRGLVQAAEAHRIPWGIVGECAIPDACVPENRQCMFSRPGKSGADLGLLVEQCVMMIIQSHGFET
jgi:hypothetical protein